MNLPVGKVVEEGLDLSELAVKELFESFIDRGFSGYIVNTISGFSGVEEALVLFRQGTAVGAFYEYLSLGKAFFGDYALQQVFNSFAAEKGVVDIVGLSVSQVDLVSAFNENLHVSLQLAKKDLVKYFTKAYSNEFALKVLNESVTDSKENKSIFKKLGLSELGE